MGRNLPDRQRWKARSDVLFVAAGLMLVAALWNVSRLWNRIRLAARSAHEKGAHVLNHVAGWSWFARVQWIGGALAVLVGAVLLALAVGEVHLMRRWTGVEARIVSASRDSVNVFARAGSSPIRYEPRIRFAYIVDGKAYRSARVYAGPTRQWADHDELDRFMDEAGYVRNGLVTAYYDARNPSRAALIVEGDYSGRILVIIAGLIFMGFGWLANTEDKDFKRRRRA